MKPTKQNTDYIVSFVWAICEATFFPVVPDVWLSISSTNTLKRGLTNVIYALLGAILGGSILYWTGQLFPSSFMDSLLLLPDVKPQLIETVKTQLHNEGLISIFKGPIKGIPYKIYATLSGTLDYNYLIFIVISVPARAFRFVLSVCLSNLFSKLVGNKLKPIYIKMILITVWVIIYMKYLQVI